MAKKPVNFRIEEVLLTRIQKEAKKQGESYTKWIMDACRMRLGDKLEVSHQEPASESEEIAKLKETVETLSDIVNYCAYSVEENQASIDDLQSDVISMRDSIEEQSDIRLNYIRDPQHVAPKEDPNEL